MQVYIDYFCCFSQKNSFVKRYLNPELIENPFCECFDGFRRITFQFKRFSAARFAVDAIKRHYHCVFRFECLWRHRVAWAVTGISFRSTPEVSAIGFHAGTGADSLIQWTSSNWAYCGRNLHVVDPRSSNSCYFCVNDDHLSVYTAEETPQYCPTAGVALWDWYSWNWLVLLMEPLLSSALVVIVLIRGTALLRVDRLSELGVSESSLYTVTRRFWSSATKSSNPIQRT